MQQATATRKQEARQALEDVLERYGDVFGPTCWCPGDDYCDGPCPEVPTTLVPAAWVLIRDYDNLCENEDEATSGLVWIASRSISISRVIGMTHRVRNKAAR